jgi:hypothetical protein
MGVAKGVRRAGAAERQRQQNQDAHQAEE